MSYTMASDLCDVAAACFDVHIDDKTSIDCGACLAVCPVVSSGSAKGANGV